MAARRRGSHPAGRARAGRPAAAPAHGAATALEGGRVAGALLGAILLVSLLLRLPSLHTDRLWPDEALYAAIVRDLIADPASLLRPEAYREHLPVVPLTLAPGALPGWGLAGMRGMTLLINLAGILLTFRLGRRVAGTHAGLCAALFLAVNPGYLHHSHLLLIDGPFAVGMLGLALALGSVRAQPRADRHDLVAGLAAVGVAAMKWYAALLVGPILGLHYWVACRGLPAAQRLRKLLLPAGCLALFAAPYLLWKGGVLADQGGVPSYFDRPALHYLWTAPAFAGGWAALLLVLLGAARLGRPAPAHRALIAGPPLVVVAVMSLAPEKDGRYLLPALPFLAVLAALGVTAAVAWLARPLGSRGRAQALALALLALGFVPLVLARDRSPLHATYTGLVEAGEAVRRLAGPDDLILAGSVRAMRYAAGRERADRVRPLPATREELRELLARHPGRVVVETDRWEFTQPAWLFPWSDAGIESLEATGLRQAARVRRPVAGQWVPVALVLVRDGP